MRSGELAELTKQLARISIGQKKGRERESLALQVDLGEEGFLSSGSIARANRPPNIATPDRVHLWY